MKIDSNSRSVDLDPRAAQFYENPYPTYHELRRNVPAFKWQQYGYWCFAGHEDVNALLRDRRFGRQILHVATVNLALLQTFGGKATPPAINAKATAKAEILKALSDSFDYGAALINEQSEAGMIEQVQARFLGPSSRLRIAYFLAGHTWDIYGQMAVYLRLNGVVPPASQRP